MKFDMGAIDQVSSKGRGWETIPVRVSDYDKTDPKNVAVIGTRLDTGEVINIALRPDTAERTKPRPEIIDISGQRKGVSKASVTAIGGVLRFDKSEPVAGKPGYYTSSWAVTLQPKPDFGDVLVGHVRVLPPFQDGDTKRQAVEVVYPDHARLARTAEQLSAALLANFQADAIGTAASFIRLQGEKDGETVTRVFKVSPTGTTGDDGFQLDEPHVSVEKWLKTPLGKALSDQLGKVAGGDAVEVIPVETLRVGADSLEKTIGTKSALDVAYRMGQESRVTGFAMSSVAVEFRENGSAYVTEVAPVRRKLFALEAVPTAHLGGQAEETHGHADEDDMVFHAADVAPPEPVPVAEKVGDQLADLDAAAPQKTRRYGGPRGR